MRARGQARASGSPLSRGAGLWLTKRQGVERRPLWAQGGAAGTGAVLRWCLRHLVLAHPGPGLLVIKGSLMCEPAVIRKPPLPPRATVSSVQAGAALSKAGDLLTWCHVASSPTLPSPQAPGPVVPWGKLAWLMAAGTLVLRAQVTLDC